MNFSELNNYWTASFWSVNLNRLDIVLSVHSFQNIVPTIKDWNWEVGSSYQGKENMQKWGGYRGWTCVDKLKVIKTPQRCVWQWCSISWFPWLCFWEMWIQIALWYSKNCEWFMLLQSILISLIMPLRNVNLNCFMIF